MSVYRERRYVKVCGKKFKEAEPLYQEELRINREIERKAGIAAALADLGNLYEAVGDFAAAARNDEQALLAFQEMGNKRSEAAMIGNWGIVLVKQGHLASAKAKKLIPSITRLNLRMIESE